MDRTLFSCVVTLGLSVPAICQQPVQKTETVPLYRVTVIERSIDAINYQYRAGPTKIDFRGTVLLANGKGDATVESRQGRTEISASFANLAAPTRFGREYLTYVLWAISPEGAPHNLGEIVPDGSDHAKLHVTTELQVFGLIVTAEPHSAVRQPSDVVVLENQVRPETLGRTQPILAKYELMPRGHYVWNVQEGFERAVATAPKVSMDRYEALLEVYQAQNAIGIARAGNAEQYAPNTLAKAEQALSEAQRLQSIRANTSLIVQSAREASQTAEDARAITERRKQDDQLAKAQAEAAQAQQARLEADAAAQRARAEADAARAQAEAERAARERVEADAALARQRAEPPAPTADRIQPILAPARTAAVQTSRTQLRLQLLERLNGVLTTRDTPRGLVATLNDGAFSGTLLRPETVNELSRVAQIIAGQTGLRVDVQGHTDSAATDVLASERAAAVRKSLAAGGVPASAIASEGFGNSRPVVSNATRAGRIENRRVEMVITGDPIGTMPYWDRPYPLAPQR
ncbi:MAG: flagellar motor protein MotB [Terriglobia bacterium]|nr:MAG: flagellar motor protein MotB [Terriglobia bacterium]